MLIALATLSSCGTTSVNPVTGKTERTVMDAAQLRLLNGALDLEPKPGQRVKVVLTSP
ncbi:hypothetical protein [Roseateles sp.]|uniref:hypothetical protein n=1 Tax=Roseateles sp. TaxID=1971397 RepID=UPI00286AF54B|nr:hypothetical protein [Roseateles sp.]